MELRGLRPRSYLIGSQLCWALCSPLPRSKRHEVAKELMRGVYAVVLAILASGATGLPEARAVPPAWVDITWMSVSNVYYEIGVIGVFTDGYISRVPRSAYFGGASGLAHTRMPFTSNPAAVRRVLDAIGGPARVNRLLTGHSRWTARGC